MTNIVLLLKEHLAEPHRREAAARLVTQRIRLWNLRAKIAMTGSSKRRAYELKARFIELGLSSLGEYFSAESFEHDERLGLVITFRLADNGFVHLPLSSLKLARNLIDLNALEYENTLISRRAHRTRLRAIRPAFG